jgi:pyridoxal phosphate enzyme (YggS family)
MAYSVAQRLDAVRERIREAEAAAGRSRGSVTLLAVSKTHASGLIRSAWQAGQRAFGENYLQEALRKMAELADLDIEWHFIGRVQSNKTRAIAEHFAWVHGVTDIRHARRLSDQRPGELPPLNACIQVNISAEDSKNGVDPDAVAPLLRQCRDLARLRVRGLMAIPAVANTPGSRREPFRELRRLRERLADSELRLDTLSMGMSADLEAAIAEGATLVRVGTAIFGHRSYGEH